MKESLSGFSFECDSRPSEERSWTLVEEGKEFAGHSIGYCFTGLVACLRLCVSCVCVFSSLTLLFISYKRHARAKWPILMHDMNVFLFAEHCSALSSVSQYLYFLVLLFSIAYVFFVFVGARIIFSCLAVDSSVGAAFTADVIVITLSSLGRFTLIWGVIWISSDLPSRSLQIHRFYC